VCVCTIRDSWILHLCLTLARYCPRWPGAVHQSSSIRARRRVAIEPRGRGARYWIVERAEGRVVIVYWTRVTPEGATSRKRGAESAAGRKLAKCEHRHPWWHLASARTERRAARVNRSEASASMNSHGRENRAGATSLEACVSTQWSSMRHMRGTFRCRRRLLRVERGY
jgi:hypothetical protein